MLERALELTKGRASRPNAYGCWRGLCGALYYSPQREQMAELSEEATAIAERLGDPEASADARAARRRALWDPTHLQERLATSTEMLTLARRAGSLELQLQAHAWLVLDLLERGDRDAVDAQIAAFSDGRRAAAPTAVPVAGGRVAGDAGAARRQARAQPRSSPREALAAGAPAEGVTAAQYYAIQLLAVRREQARIGELEPAARQMVASNPDAAGLARRAGHDPV